MALELASGPSLSKALRPGTLFTLTDSGSGDADTASALGDSQVKVKEVLWERDATNGTLTAVELYLVSGANEYLVAEATISAGTDVNARIAATMTSGEFLVPGDAELKVKTAGVDGADNWTVRVHCVVIRAA